MYNKNISLRLPTVVTHGYTESPIPSPEFGDNLTFKMY